MTKAQELLEKSKDTKARAESFFTTIKRNITTCGGSRC